MGTVFDQQFEHLLRRAGFGARPDELATFRTLSFNGAVDRLVNYEQIADDVDSKIFQPGYVGVTSPPGIFAPGAIITDARQRWLFRMIHTNRPLQEQMTLFWHNHFAAARVFTGWNLARPGVAADGSQHYEFVYNAAQHEPTEKTFSFPIYPGSSKTIPARSAADGMQDGLDLIGALAGNPDTARYLARKLYRFFVSEAGAVDEAFVNRIANVYLLSRYDMRT